MILSVRAQTEALLRNMFSDRLTLLSIEYISGGLTPFAVQVVEKRGEGDTNSFLPLASLSR